MGEFQDLKLCFPTAYLETAEQLNVEILLNVKKQLTITTTKYYQVVINYLNFGSLGIRTVMELCMLWNRYVVRKPGMHGR